MNSNLKAGITFHHPVAFWVGTAAVTAGVFMHMPDFLAASEMGYRMVGMEMSAIMYAGMALVVGGMVLAAWGLIPSASSRAADAESMGDVQLKAMDSAHLSPAHWGLLFVLGVALIMDVMKPALLGFVLPGTKAEYGLTTAQLAVLPFIALGGTTLGSFLFGILSDRIGRRSAILLASIMFIGTAICGFMPSYAWNIFMCFVMGISAGGMLPIVYALMAESIPARKRGWLVVLHGGMGTVGGYLVASGLTTLLEPHFGWRILWFTGLPTGLLLLVLNRWIPESPRFLIEHGRIREAEEVMGRYGVVVEKVERVPEPEPLPQPVAATSAAGPSGSRLMRLFRAPYLPQTITVGMYGLAWGLVNWGFLTFIPSILRDYGLDASSASRMLFFSALIAVPGTVLVAYLYGLWSSKKSMILFALLTAASMIGFAVVNPGASGEPSPYLTPLMVLLLVGSGGVIAMLSPYTAEVYPTQVRGTGSGFAAGSSKAGGIMGPPLVALILGLSPGFTVLGLTLAVPMGVSALILAAIGVETRDRSLEELATAERVAA